MIETKYIDLSEKIEKGIKKGLWKERLPGVIKLGRELNADPATLSKAFKLLAGKGLVTILGKRGTFITRPGRGVKHKVIGIVGMKTEHPSFAEEFSAMEKTADAKGYRAIGIAHKNDLFVKDLDLLLKFPVDGYIFMYSRLTLEIAAFLRENGIPFVSCNRPAGISGVNWVDFDSEGNLEKSLRHLIEAGHRRIAYIEFYNPNYSFSERILSKYKKVLLESGIPFDESLFISRDQYRYYNLYGDGYSRAYGIDCANEILKQKEKITAVVITSPAAASSFVGELKKHKMSVPEDISIVTYNSPWSKEEKFTTLYNDYRKRASTAVRMLMDLIDNPSSEIKQEVVPARIIDKKSCSGVKKERKSK